MNATKAAQNGVKFNIAAVMMGWALLRPMSYNTNPDTPTRNTAASLGRFRTSSSIAAKSRRLSPRAISSGTENSNAHWVKPIKSIELRSPRRRSGERRLDSQKDRRRDSIEGPQTIVGWTGRCRLRGHPADAPAHHFTSMIATLIAVLDALVSSTSVKSPLAYSDAMLSCVTRTSKSYAERVRRTDIYL